MDDDLEVPVNYKNQELIFIAKFIQFRYSYKFEVDVNGVIVFFEPDDERNFRAIIDPAIDHVNHKIDKELIQLIAEALATMLQ
jgi:DNA polymerase III delta subunit